MKIIDVRCKVVGCKSYTKFLVISLARGVTVAAESVKVNGRTVSSVAARKWWEEQPGDPFVRLFMDEDDFHRVIVAELSEKDFAPSLVQEKSPAGA